MDGLPSYNRLNIVSPYGVARDDEPTETLKYVSSSIGKNAYMYLYKQCLFIFESFPCHLKEYLSNSIPRNLTGWRGQDHPAKRKFSQDVFAVAGDLIPRDALIR